MSAADHEDECGCCAPRGRPPAIIDYIERGLRRRRRARLPLAGEPAHDHEGRHVRFSLGLSGGVIADVVFETNMCVTLVAYCELLAEGVTGLSLDAGASRIDGDALAASLPQVPPHKRVLSELAAAGLQSAFVAAARKE